MRPALLCTLALAAMLALPTAASAREPYAVFYTPGKAVLCSAVIDITGDNPNFVPSLFCWTPNDGFTVTLTASRRPRASTLKYFRWHYEPGGRALRFDQAWWMNRQGMNGWGGGVAGDVLIRCVSRSLTDHQEVRRPALLLSRRHQRGEVEH